LINDLMPSTGGCLCGAIRFAVETSPRSVHYCHCSMCRRATGGPFAVIVWFPVTAVRWQSAHPQSRASSAIARRSFCSTCGTPIFLQYTDSDELGFMVGTFDDPNKFVPQYHYGIEGRLQWVDAGALLPPGRETEEVL
jgi:hypothetical protein